MSTPRLTLFQKLKGTPDVFAAFEEVNRALASMFPGIAEKRKGAWSSGTLYRVDDIVTYGGSSYVCLAEHSARVPSASSDFWGLFAAAGEAGAAGAAGSSGSSATSRAQTVIAGAVDSSTGMANFLSAGSGLTVDLAATATTVLVSFAAGYTSSGSQNYIGAIEADDAAAWTLPASKTSYLYVERDSGDGTLSYGYSPYSPLYGPYPPSYHSKPVSAGSATVDGGTGSGSAAAAFDGDPTNYWGSSQTGAAVSGAAYIGIDAGVGNTIKVAAFTIRNSGIASNHISSVLAQWSSDGAAWTTTDTIAISATTDAQNTYTVSSYTAARYWRLLANANPGGANPWRVAELSVWHKPDGMHWFDLSEMVMYEWDEGGAQWTAAQRVFVGEAVTDGASVTSCTTYALNGKYDSGWFAVNASASQYNKTHNLGIAMCDGVTAAVYYSDLGSSYDAIPLEGQSYAGANRNGFSWMPAGASPWNADTRNTAYIQIDNGIPVWRNTSRTVGFYRLQMRRTW